MTIAVDLGRKATKQTNKTNLYAQSNCLTRKYLNILKTNDVYFTYHMTSRLGVK